MRQGEAIQTKTAPHHFLPHFFERTLVMRKIIGSFFVALLCLSAIGLCQQEAAEPELDFDAANKAFNQLLNEFGTHLKASDALAKSAAAGGKFVAVAPSVPYAGGGGQFDGVDTAVRVWFELADGRFVNPRFYRWAPGEMFYVHVQSAVPVYVRLFQNFPASRSRSGLVYRPSKLVYPTPNFPESFQIIMPGVSTRLPVLFRMDMNFNPEHMSILVSRADSDFVRPYVPQAATTAINAYGTAYVQAQTTTNPDGTTTTNSEAVVHTTLTSEGIWKNANVQGILKGAELRSDAAEAKFAVVNSACFNHASGYSPSYEATFNDGSKFRPRYRVVYPRVVRPTYYVRYYNNRPTYVNINQVNITNVNYVNNYIDTRGCYQDHNDVAFYLFSGNGVGQIQLTLNKIGSNWQWYGN